jgi:hypothetical protein
MDRKNGLADIEVSLALQAQSQVMAVENKQMGFSIPHQSTHFLHVLLCNTPRPNNNILTQPSSHQPQSALHPSPHSSQHLLSARVQAAKAQASCCRKAIVVPLAGKSEPCRSSRCKEFCRCLGL